jgi:hypothetical protein
MVMPLLRTTGWVVLHRSESMSMQRRTLLGRFYRSLQRFFTHACIFGKFVAQLFPLDTHMCCPPCSPCRGLYLVEASFEDNMLAFISNAAFDLPPMFWAGLLFLQTLEDGDMALLDMGAEYQFFGSDITCSFPASSLLRFTCYLQHSYILFDLIPQYLISLSHAITSSKLTRFHGFKWRLK